MLFKTMACISCSLRTSKWRPIKERPLQVSCEKTVLLFVPLRGGSPGESHQGRSRRCWAQAGGCCLWPPASGSPETHSRLQAHTYMGWDQKASTSLATNYLRLDFQLSGFTDVCVSVHGLKNVPILTFALLIPVSLSEFSAYFYIWENDFYFFICCKNALTRVLLLCKSHNVDAIDIILLRRKTDMYKYH